MLLIFTVLVSLLFTLLLYPLISASSSQSDPQMIFHNKLAVQKIATGLDRPTGLGFVDEGERDILIIQKDGKVKLVRDFDTKKYPVMDLNVYDDVPDSGLLGITTDRTKGEIPFVFLSYTASPLLGSDTTNSNGVRHLIYRYEWNSTGLQLDNPVLVLDLPYFASNYTNLGGGKITIGSEDSLFSATRTLPDSIENDGNTSNKYCNTDFNNGFILLTEFVNSIYHSRPKIYACGTSNTLSLASDHITGSLWNAQETIYSKMGQINLITPDFHGSCDNVTKRQNCHNPEFVFPNSTIPTAIDFSRPGNSIGFNNSMFVGDMKGNLYLFHFDRDRKTLNDYQIIGSGFGQISDIKSAPGGALYILTNSYPSDNATSIPNKDGGILYRVSTSKLSLPVYESYLLHADQLGLVGILLALASITTFLVFSKAIKIDKLRL